MGEYGTPNIESRSYALIPDIRWDGSRRKVAFLEKVQRDVSEKEYITVAAK